MRFILWQRALATALIVASVVGTSPATAQSLLDYVGECAPFARAASGIQLYGDAWTWWDKAAGKYRRGRLPEPGAVIVFERTARLPLGHVAVVSRLVDSRVVMVTHANWSRVDGARGHVEQDVTLADVSPANDWSMVRVWHGATNGLGTTVYPAYGFIYAGQAHGTPRPDPALSGRQPDEIAALIDAYR